MPFQSRIKQLSFIENQHQIESDWDIDFGDRKNEIVFIGQNMNETLIRFWIGAYQQIKNWKQNNGKKDIKMILLSYLKMNINLNFDNNDN